jgi:hypothetical protein
VRLDPALGGGSLWDVGCYPVSYAMPARRRPPVERLGWQQTSRRGVDLEFAGMMRFSDGSVAQFDSGFVGPFRAENGGHRPGRRRCASTGRSAPTT